MAPAADVTPSDYLLRLVYLLSHDIPPSFISLPGLTMTSPNPTKLSDHLAKFRYTPSSQSTSPKRRAVTQDDEPVPSPKRRLTTPLADAPSDSSATRTTPPKQRKLNRSYAAPETYAHLKAVPDLLRPGLTVVFCGIK